MRTLPPRPRGATGLAAPPSPAAPVRGTAASSALPGLVKRPARATAPAPAPGGRGARPAWVENALTALDLSANRVAAQLPPQARRWLLRATGASAGTIGLLGLIITAEALKVRSHPFLPETVYDRILRFPGTGPEGEPGTPLTLAVLGDSTTTGIGTERVEDTYAALVGQALATRGPVEVHVLGRAGARLAHVIEEQLPLVKRLRPDLILLVVGANDATHVTPLADVRDRIRRILGELVDTPLVLAGVPRLSLARVVPSPLRELSTYRGLRVTSVMRRSARDHRNVRFVSLSMRPVDLDGVPMAWLSTDRFHPSAYGYAQWAQAFLPALLDADPRVPQPASQPDPVLDPVPDVVAALTPGPFEVVVPIGAGLGADLNAALDAGIQAARQAPIMVALETLRQRLRRRVAPAPEVAG